MKSLNYKVGALKRKFKIKGDFAPGTLISKVNENKSPRPLTQSARLLNTNSPMTAKKLGVKGLI